MALESFAYLLGAILDGKMCCVSIFRITTANARLLVSLCSTSSESSHDRSWRPARYPTRAWGNRPCITCPTEWLLGHHILLAADAIRAGEEVQLILVADLGAEDVVERLAHRHRQVQAVVAALLAQAQLVFGALAQPVMGQLQLAQVHVVLLQTVDAQQRVQVLGEYAQLLQLAVFVRHDLRRNLYKAHEALQVLF
jgi:hypothetical protein